MNIKVNFSIAQKLKHEKTCTETENEKEITTQHQHQNHISALKSQLNFLIDLAHSALDIITNQHIQSQQALQGIDQIAGITIKSLNVHAVVLALLFGNHTIASVPTMDSFDLVVGWPVMTTQQLISNHSNTM